MAGRKSKYPDELKAEAVRRLQAGESAGDIAVSLLKNAQGGPGKRTSTKSIFDWRNEAEGKPTAAKKPVLNIEIDMQLLVELQAFIEQPTLKDRSRLPAKTLAVRLVEELTAINEQKKIADKDAALKAKIEEKMAIYEKLAREEAEKELAEQHEQ